MKTVTATFKIEVSWLDDPKNHLTPQMLRDKLLTQLQEMWISFLLTKLSIEQVEQNVISHIEHKNIKGERKSFYKTGFPKQKTRKNKAKKEIDYDN